MRWLPVVLLFAFTVSSRSQTWYTKINLSDSLRVQTPEGWNSLSEAGKATSAWLMLDAIRYRGDYLVVESSKPIYLFIEGKLAASDTRTISWPVDSISRLFGKRKLRLNLYQPQGIFADVQIYIQTPLPAPALAKDEPDLRKAKIYRDFLLSALALTVVILLGMLRVNRLFVLSYLNVSSLLSFRESEDHPIYNRVTNTTNILLLFLIALLYSVLRIHPKITEQDFTALWADCLKETIALGALFLAKGLVIYLFSAMFNISALKGLQYIGFVRYLLIWGLVLLGLQIAGVFIFSSFSLNLLMSRFFAGMFGIVWFILIWGKLRVHTAFNAIHLFSYLCATEIGPILLTATNWKV